MVILERSFETFLEGESTWKEAAEVMDAMEIRIIQKIEKLEGLVRYSRPMNSARSHIDITRCRFPDSEIDVEKAS
jgi:hypothetical protein